MSAPSNNNADSPNKANRVRNVFTTGDFDLTEKRDELRYTMHRKVTLVEYGVFMAEFMPEAPLACPSPFANIIPTSRQRPSFGRGPSSRGNSIKRTTRASTAAMKQAQESSPFHTKESNPRAEVDMYTRIVSSFAYITYH